jgi:DNA-binding response OmpR family regulator
MKKVLIVEDDQFLIDAYRAKFSHFSDIVIDVARDGEEALAKVNTDKPSAIILDLVTPNLDGFGFLKALHDKVTTIPILVSSNLDSQEDIRQAIDMGAQDYFIKSNSTVKDIVDKVVALIK